MNELSDYELRAWALAALIRMHMDLPLEECKVFAPGCRALEDQLAQEAKENLE